MGLGSLIDAIDELAADDARTLGDGDTLVEIERQLARLEAIASRAAAAFDAGGEWRATGARSAAMWLAANTNHAVSSMRGRVRLGRDVRSMPIVEHAWMAGDIKTSHVRHLASARTPSTADLFARDEAILVGFAKTKRFSHFYRAVDYWKQRADAEGAEDADKQKVEGRHAHLSETYGGVWIGEQVFDPIGGTTVATELKRLEQQLFDADWNAAKQRLGREPSTLELGRTASQRRADAWVEMAKRSAAMAPGSRMPRPLITVLVGYETFAGPVCQLAGGAVVAPGTVARLLTDADIERVVFDGPSRVIDVGVRRRLFQGGTRRAVEIRDHNQGCFHPLCDATLDDNVQVDHIHPYAFGGLTTQANGRLACAKHNRGRNTRPPPNDS